MLKRKKNLGRGVSLRKHRAQHLRIVVIIIFGLGAFGIKPKPPNLWANELQQEQWLVGGGGCSFVFNTEKNSSGNDRVFGPVVLWDEGNRGYRSKLPGIDGFEKLLWQEEVVTVLEGANCSRHRDFFFLFLSLYFLKTMLW